MPQSATTVDLVIPSELGEVRRIQSDVKEALAAAHFDEKDLFSVELALEEALVNAIKHGNQLDSDKKVHVQYSIDDKAFNIRIEDEGEGFCVDDVPDPTLPENICKPCGRGLLMIRKFMTDVNYNDRGNVITMSKLRNGSS